MLELWDRGYYETLSQQSNICSHQIVDASCTKRSTTKPPCVVWFEWFSKWSTCHWSQKKTHWHSSLKVSKERKRGQCSVEAMKRAIKAVEEGNRLRGAARMFNVPVETLWMRVAGAVPIQCRPGPKPMLAVDEEEAIASYCVKMVWNNAHFWTYAMCMGDDWHSCSDLFPVWSGPVRVLMRAKDHAQKVSTVIQFTSNRTTK